MRGAAEQRRGLWLGVAAYIMWGLFPLYWPHLKPAGAVEILAHRMVWSLVFMVLVLAVLRRWSWIRELLRNPARLAKIVLAGVVITTNWGLYIWGVNTDQVVETSLGYFINPLAFIMIGVLVLGERLRGAQWIAVGLGIAAVLVLTVAYGRLPWLALVLATSFTIYGYVKKTVGLAPTESLTAETAVMFLPAAGYLVYLSWTGEGTLGTVSAGHTLLLMGTGVVTAIPLLCFGAAAVRVPLSTIGMLQYLGPILQFSVGVWIYHEAMPTSRWIGFGLIWTALVVLSADALAQSRRTRRAVADAREAAATTASSSAPAPPATLPAEPADPARAPARAPRTGSPTP
ncbi:EamA family transporter RarD [Yinghuangia seranimata]|uniref:EamA family transporter RarD n=1 Tax=Yinghuangia seranimata TaxID=408067 RepID=UPI00248BCF91|nr:EamA family transporter RarD [Yinghuangia seranimata]MDI2128573.1 EamA family transporter RarD [Yinghuangia seranimata]